MGGRVYFRLDDIRVSDSALIVGQAVYPITDILSARCERARVRWLWPLPIYSFALQLVMADGERVRAVQHRNAYYIFQLVNAVQAALEDSQQPAAFAEKSSA